MYIQRVGKQTTGIEQETLRTILCENMVEDREGRGGEYIESKQESPKRGTNEALPSLVG